LPRSVIICLLSLFASGVAQALPSVAQQAGAAAQLPLPAIQMQKNTLVVGSEQNYPPFAVGMSDANAGGFTVDLWKAVAAEAGLNYTIRVQPFRQILQEFKEGQIDVLINLAISDERHHFADFTVPHVIVHGAIFVRKDESLIHSEEDLTGRSIIVLNADLAHDYAVSKGWEPQLVLVDTAAEGLRLLASGKHDAMLLSKLTGMQTLQELGLSNIKALRVKTGFSQKFAFAVPAGQSDLLGRINEGLAFAKSNGTYTALYDKWFGIYEDKEVGLRDLLKYLLPIVLLFLAIAGHFIYRRQLERYAAQKTLQASENHFRLSQISGGIGTWEADLVNNSQKWSESCTDLLDFPAQSEPTWEDFLALVHPEDRQHVLDATQSHLDHDTKYDVEYRAITAGGEIRWLRSAGQAERDKDGKPVRMRGIAQNITERKLAESKLRESERKLSDILDSVDAYIYLKDTQGRYLYANRQVRDLFGASMEEIVGQDDEKFFDAETVAQLRNNDRPVLEDGRTLRTEETNLIVKDGRASTYLSVKLPLRNEADQIYALCGISTDITERKQMEVQLVQSVSLLHATLESTHDAILVVDLNGAWKLHNQRFIDLWHITDAIIAVKDDSAALPYVLNQLDDADAFLNKVHELYAMPESSSFDTLNFKNGKIVERYSIPQRVDGKVVGRVWSFRDVTESKQAEAEIIESQNLLLTVIDTAPIRVFWKDLNLRYLGCNMAFAQDAGMTHPSHVLGKDDYQMGWAAQAELYRADDQAVMASGIAKLSYDEPQTTPNGQTIWLRTSKVPLKNQDNETLGLLGIYEDITERKHAEQKLQLAASVFTHAREGIMITGADGTIIDINDAFTSITSITGYERDETLGRNPRLLSSGRQGKVFYDAMWSELREKGQWYGEVWNQRKNGEVFVEILSISAVRDARGTAQHYVALFSDITSLKEHEQQLEHIAHYDALTSLPNRVLLADRLHQGMTQALRRGQRLAVAFLDLDGFKTINDNHGHEAGDQLLITVSIRMKQALREGDTLARLGGDEFVAVLVDLEDIAASVPMLTRLLAAAAQPVHVGDLVLQVSASLGVSFYPQAEDIDADQLLRQADQAMYQAKLAGKNRYYIFDAVQDRSVRGHHESLEHIRHALTASEFVLYYQPKVNMRTGLVIGAEALIRWQHPEKGLLPPAVFLPVIEDHPLAVDIGEWVIDTALTQVELWHAVGLNIPVSVNVGARQLQQPDFVERLTELLAAHPDVRPGDLELEVLETSALENVTGVSQVIEACREIGINFALDDFGTGYSSLTYLKRLPVALLKIDQSFVRDMLSDPDDLAIIEGVVGLASAFRRQVIAEGVESVEHGAMLLQLGCELAQGYGIARPMPAHRLPGWSADWRPDPAWVNLSSVSRNELPVLFAGVEHRVWVAAIAAFLKGERDAPMPQGRHQCRFGMWLDAEGLIRYGGQPIFEVIEPLHRQIHALAEELCELHAQGRKPEALARLGELHELQDALLEQLTLLAQGTRH